MGHAGGDNRGLEAVAVKDIGVAASAGDSVFQLHVNGVGCCGNSLDYRVFLVEIHGGEIRLNFKFQARFSFGFSAGILPVCYCLGECFFDAFGKLFKFPGGMASYFPNYGYLVGNYIAGRAAGNCAEIN